MSTALDMIILSIADAEEDSADNRIVSLNTQHHLIGSTSSLI